MAECFSYEILKEGEERILRIDCDQCTFTPSLEDNETAMLRTVDILAEVGTVSRIIFYQKRDYEYDFDQVKILVEIARFYKDLVDQKILAYGEYGAIPECERYFPNRYTEMQRFLRMLRGDPIAAYFHLKTIYRQEKIKLEGTIEPKGAECLKQYLNLLNFLITRMDELRIIILTRGYFSEWKPGERQLYARIFRPTIKPDFLFAKLMSTYPAEGEELDAYAIGETDVTIFGFKDSVKTLYHIVPPEFKLSESEYDILDNARRIMAEHKPTKQEFVDPERMRDVFYNVGRDLIEELAEHKGEKLRKKDIDELAEILVRYTVGFGLIEVLLQDQKIQDISINSPMGQTPIFIVHADYGDCFTNIIPTDQEAESWASKLRLLSGRPLDEANPILDTELVLPDARARVSAITSPLNPNGLAFSFRRHRDKPWTLSLFVKVGMIDELGAGLLSFLIDGTRTLLIAGTRSSGKSSLLGSLLVEIMQRYRIITVEDSVTADTKILVQKNGKFVNTTIGELVDSQIRKHGTWHSISGHETTGNKENIKVFAMNKDGKILLAPVSKFIRHKVSKPIYKITTRTGRTIKVTGDHSLFTLEGTEVKEIKTSSLKEGSYIAVPNFLPLFSKGIKEINLLDHIEKLPGYLEGDPIKNIENKEKVFSLGKEQGYSKSTMQNWLRKGILPCKIAKDLKINHLECHYKLKKNAEAIPTKIALDETFLAFCGLWLADGCYSHKSVVISSITPEERGIINAVVDRLGIREVKFHSDDVSVMINSVSFRYVLREILGLKGDAYTTRLPEWAFDLNKKQLGALLKGIFSGKGSVDKEIVISLASKDLLYDIQTALLSFGINLRIRNIRKDKTYPAGISTAKEWKIFAEKIGFIQHHKNNRLNSLCLKISTHALSIPLSKETKIELSKIVSFNKNDYLVRNNSFGREKLQSLLFAKEHPLLEKLKTLLLSDIYWDQISEIKQLPLEEQYVYDLSVPECESFICENIVAHNTLELPTDAMRKLGYNIQPMKVGSALTKGTTEFSASDGIRATLRLGDSALIIGEVRSSEAIALYEAMRVGAAANVVAGTIHGDSPYGVFDRVVNDIGVPKTSFKATDIIIVANPVRSPDGLHKWRRVTQITEVRKTWEEDPLAEGGFVDLMKYNPLTDKLEPTDALLNGDSEILKSIASNIKEFAGNWEAIWNNVLLRARVKKELVDAAIKNNDDDLLEAPFVIKANDALHLAIDQIRQKEGKIDDEKVFFLWKTWLEREVKKRQKK